MTIKLIVAHDERRGIGRGGTLPWHIPGEARWTSEVTRTAPPGSRNALVMGRTTYLSIPEKRRPLFNRFNIVVTSRQNAFDEAVQTAPNFVEALYLASGIHDVNNVFIFGGASIYRQALEMLVADEILISVVAGNYQCDTFFPELPSAYHLTSTATAWYENSEVRHNVYSTVTSRGTRSRAGGR
ncbi:dihydrofolate reductase [Mycobacterium servetii]|uniref:dihydrofolate reductase n=1 Tax=Mycobacterium servetii TaxID=3237418 RepID=A0ABV4C965_9MYCO